MYRRKSKSWLKHLDFIVLDIIIIQFSFILAFQIRHGSFQAYQNALYRDVAVFLCLIDLVVVFINESYKGVLRRGKLQEIKHVVKHITYVILLLLLYLFLSQDGDAFSRITFITTWIFATILMWTSRTFLKDHLIQKNSHQVERSMVVITSSNIAESCIQSLTSRDYEPFQVTGICIVDQNMIGQEIRGIPVVADEKSMLDYIKYNWVDEVFVNLPKEIPLSEQLIQACSAMGITIHLILMRFNGIDTGNKIVERIGDYTVLSSSINIATERQAFLKRAMDIAGGLVGTLMTGIITIIVGPIIYFQSPGPIFFSQERIGRNGKKFKMYKFRSMYMDAEQRKQELMEQNSIQDGMMFKMENDPRIIGRKDGREGIGHFIRKTSLDEFPQFLNVLKGDMSLVGTRPPTPDEWEKYELHHRVRLAIKPGVTGLWQVSGRSDIKNFEEVVALDASYIQNWNLGLDIKILFKTVGVVFKQEGSS